MIAWAQRRQILLYLVGIVAGASLGLALPGASPAFEVLVAPALVLLLYATFLAVPFAEIGPGLRDVRFLGAVIVLNFVLVPALVFALSRFVAHDEALLVGLLLVLLTPCVDYVIVFTRLAGGAASKLLAVSPVVMVLQMVLLPGYLALFAGPDVVGSLDAGPFVSAFLLFLALPAAAAAATQSRARRSVVVRGVERAMDAATVPIMTATLAVIVAAQIDVVRSQPAALAGVVPLYAVFLVVAALAGFGVARMSGQGVASGRALMFSGATRNSLVILPLALALPERFALAPAAVMTQTLVELVGMVAMVRLVPRLMPERPD